MGTGKEGGTAAKFCRFFYGEGSCMLYFLGKAEDKKLDARRSQGDGYGSAAS